MFKYYFPPLHSSAEVDQINTVHVFTVAKSYGISMLIHLLMLAPAFGGMGASPTIACARILSPAHEPPPHTAPPAVSPSPPPSAPAPTAAASGREPPAVHLEGRVAAPALPPPPPLRPPQLRARPPSPPHPPVSAGGRPGARPRQRCVARVGTSMMEVGGAGRSGVRPAIPVAIPPVVAEGRGGRGDTNGGGAMRGPGGCVGGGGRARRRGGGSCPLPAGQGVHQTARCCRPDPVSPCPSSALYRVLTVVTPAPRPLPRRRRLSSGGAQRGRIGERGGAPAVPPSTTWRRGTGVLSVGRCPPLSPHAPCPCDGRRRYPLPPPPRPGAVGAPPTNGRAGWLRQPGWPPGVVRPSRWAPSAHCPPCRAPIVCRYRRPTPPPPLCASTPPLFRSS